MKITYRVLTDKNTPVKIFRMSFLCAAIVPFFGFFWALSGRWSDEEIQRSQTKGSFLGLLHKLPFMALCFFAEAELWSVIVYLVYVVVMVIAFIVTKRYRIKKETLENRCEESIETIMAKMDRIFFAQYSDMDSVEPIVAALLYASCVVAIGTDSLREKFVQSFLGMVVKRFSAEQLTTYDNAVDLFVRIARGEVPLRGDWCDSCSSKKWFVTNMIRAKCTTLISGGYHNSGIPQLLIAGGDVLYQKELVGDYEGTPLKIKTTHEQIAFENKYTELIQTVFNEFHALYTTILKFMIA